MTTTCQAATHRRRNNGIMSKGAESFTTLPGVCGKSTIDGSDFCPKHQAQAARISAALAAKKARTLLELHKAGEL
jgi:hypothetical protein